MKCYTVSGRLMFSHDIQANNIIFRQLCLNWLCKRVLLESSASETCPEKDIEYTADLVTNFFGVKITKKKTYVLSWSECSKWCSTLDDCKAWTYSTIQRTCTAKTNNEQRRSAQGFVSGSRDCKEDVKPLDSTIKPTKETLTRNPNTKTPKQKHAGKTIWFRFRSENILSSLTPFALVSPSGYHVYVCPLMSPVKNLT